MHVASCWKLDHNIRIKRCMCSILWCSNKIFKNWTIVDELWHVCMSMKIFLYKTGAILQLWPIVTRHKLLPWTSSSPSGAVCVQYGYLLGGPLQINFCWSFRIPVARVLCFGNRGQSTCFQFPVSIILLTTYDDITIWILSGYTVNNCWWAPADNHHPKLDLMFHSASPGWLFQGYVAQFSCSSLAELNTLTMLKQGTPDSIYYWGFCFLSDNVKRRYMDIHNKSF